MHAACRIFIDRSFLIWALSLPKLGWRRLDLQPSVGCEQLIHMIKEGETTILDSIPLYLGVVKFRTRSIVVLVRTQILYTTSRPIVYYYFFLVVFLNYEVAKSYACPLQRIRKGINWKELQVQVQFLQCLMKQLVYSETNNGSCIYQLIVVVAKCALVSGTDPKGLLRTKRQTQSPRITRKKQDQLLWIQRTSWKVVPVFIVFQIKMFW